MDLQERSSGILLPIFSLPGTAGVGAMGQEARNFVDFLVESGQSWWQLLPVNPIDACYSPYSSSSAFAGEALYIDLEELVEEELLTSSEIGEGWIPNGESDNRADYHLALTGRRKAWHKAFERYRSGHGGDKYRRAWDEFRVRNAFWLDDYALFMAISEECGNSNWKTWRRPLRLWKRFSAARPFREALIDAFGLDDQDSRSDELIHRIGYRIEYYSFLQLVFDLQWRQLKEYCNDRGIHLLGDVPIYVGLSGADTWSHPELFQLDEDGNMLRIAGVPGDSFNGDCQRWDSPLYDWDRHAQNGFAWWMERIGHTMQWFDALRLDHFIGFYNYYSFPGVNAEQEDGAVAPGDTHSNDMNEPDLLTENAIVDSDIASERVYAKGWRPGPQEKLFDILFAKFPRERFIAEDLGVMNAGVHRLRNHYGLPGMNVLQFSFDHQGRIDPTETWEPNSVACTGTHDTPTLLDWLATLEKTGPEHWDPSNFAHVWHVLLKYQHEEEKVSMDFDSQPDAFLPEYDFWRYSKVSPEERDRAAGSINAPVRVMDQEDPVRPDVVALCRPAIRAVMNSRSDTALFPMQDILGLGASSRMNLPGSNEGNWRWRLVKSQLTPELAQSIATMVVQGNRTRAQRGQNAPCDG